MLVLRVAKLEDQAPAMNVSERAYRALRDVYRPTAAAVAQKDLTGPSYQRLVGEWGCRVIATVEYRLTPNSLHLRALAVDPGSQRRGIAGMVIDELVSMARAHGRRAVTLYTIKETGNVKVFERLGFRVLSEQLAAWCESDQFEVLHEIRMEREVT